MSNTSGSRLRHQYAFVRMEDYVFLPEKKHLNLSSGAVFITAPTFRSRPVFHHITHR